MLSFLLFAKHVLLYSFAASVKIGQCIVTLASWTFSTVFTVLAKLFALCNILVEDFAVFVQDIYQHLKYIGSALAEIHESCLKCLTWILQGLQSAFSFFNAFLNNTQNAISSCIAFTTSSIVGFFTSLKQMLVMFGEGSWFLLVFIPKSICSFIVTCLELAVDSLISIFVYSNNKAECLLEGAVQLKSNIYNFLTDVSIESVLGLVFACCCIYILVHFYTIMLMYVRGLFVRLVRSLRRGFYRAKLLLNRCTVTKITQRLDVIETKANDDDDQRLCIICQDHSRCILLLPCRHLCMCEGCSLALRQYNGSCPICRKRIRRTIKVFT